MLPYAKGDVFIMKKALKFLPIFILSFIFMASVAYAVPAITTTGNGTITVTPNMATINLGVSLQADNVAEGFQRNTATITRLNAALQELGIASDDIVTGNFWMFPQRQWGEYGERDIFMIENMLSITVRNLDMVNSVITTAVNNGATNINNISFENSNMEHYYQRALRLAVENGTRRATVIAEAAGTTLGPLSSIEEGWPSFGGHHIPAFGARGAATQEADGNAITPPNQLNISATVTLTFGGA